MVIDSHIHVFSDQIAERARVKLEQTAGIPASNDMTEAGTRAFLRDKGIDLAVVAPIATKPAQEVPINEWAASIDHGNLVSFGTVYPGGDAPHAQLQRIRDLGLHGIKLHPDYQNFFADDPAMFPLYEATSDAGLPVLFHAGRDPISMSVTHCTPQMLRRVSEIFPELQIIGAHMGGNMMYDAVEHDLAGAGVYIDISLSVVYATPEQVQRIIERHGADHVLFATDTPWSSPEATLELVRSLPLSEDDRERILWKNAARLLKLDEAAIAERLAEGV